jgi:endo-1,4-beta-D-glucanase Y
MVAAPGGVAIRRASLVKRLYQPRMWFLLPLAVLGLTAVCALGQAGTPALNAWPLWDSYKAQFYDPHGRIVDHDDGDRTTSEAQAYGMFFALVADDRETLDRLLRWTQSNLAAGDLAANLPAWLWGRKKNGSWGVMDRNPASDADLWISYTLLQAGGLWNEPRYTALGKAVLALVEEQEIAILPRFGGLLLPSNHGFSTQQETILNPSYLPPQIIAALARASPASVWEQMSESLPGFLQASSRHGFAMDWIACDSDGQVRAVPGPGTIAGGSYDAIRVYLWAGMLANQAPGRAEILRSVTGMANYLRHHDVPVERVGDDGQILSAAGNVGFSAAVLPYLSAAGEDVSLARQQARLQTQFDSTTGLFGKEHRYYTQNLAMFATGWVERRFGFGRDGGLWVAWSKP